VLAPGSTRRAGGSETITVDIDEVLDAEIANAVVPQRLVVLALS
jgi:hypothetical protein